MPNLVSDKFHVHTAKQFAKSLSPSANDVYYLFIGRPTSWANGDDVTVPTPSDSVSNTSFDYWSDIIGFKRITSNNLIQVIKRHNWQANTQYIMYDHRISANALADGNGSFYIINSALEVFKCLDNGQTNSTSGASVSTAEPTITGQADITLPTVSAGTPKNYTWKFMYNISPSQATKYMTNDYIPVDSVGDVLDANGDILDDSSNVYKVFNTARLSGNGQLYTIVIENEGSGYTSEPQVIITGDGDGAIATASISSGKISAINIVNSGSNYSHATVAISGGNGSGAKATAIISPRNSFSNSSGLYYFTNHGINPEFELFAKYVMLYTELSGTETGNITTANDYRRIGIIKNPVLYGTSTLATGNVYSQTTDLLLVDTTGAFALDEVVWQPSTNAYGVVIEQKDQTIKLVGVSGMFSVTGNTYIIGIGNGYENGMTIGATTIPSVPESFTPTIAPSGVEARISAITPPSFSPYSGDILYVDNKTPIVRANDQTEIIRTILTF